MFGLANSQADLVIGLLVPAISGRDSERAADADIHDRFGGNHVARAHPFLHALRINPGFKYDLAGRRHSAPYHHAMPPITGAFHVMSLSLQL